MKLKKTPLPAKFALLDGATLYKPDQQEDHNLAPLPYAFQDIEIYSINHRGQLRVRNATIILN